MKFPQLVQVALLGTERQALPPVEAGSALGALQAKLDSSRRESALLSAAALAAAHEQAGRLPSRDVGLLPEPCAEEKLPRANPNAASLLYRLLEGEHPPLLPEWLSLATTAQRLAPPEHLPGLLCLGADKVGLREAILPVLGERGRWLAHQNPEWAWVGGGSPDEALWHTGEPPARLLFLRRMRRENPARALELLASTWKQEDPGERAAFIAILELGLGPGDEAFIEAALDDKRKEVRSPAAGLLAQLPESAFAQRMTRRALPLLKFIPGEAGGLLKLKRSRPAVIEVTLPETCDKAAQRDGIEPKPAAGWGEKAWWLVQILGAVPLACWTQAWQVSPAEILAASRAGEWTKELFEGWARAARTQQNSSWSEAVFPDVVAQLRFDLFSGLLAALSPARRENSIAGLLAQDDAKVRDQFGALVGACHHEWSLEFSRAVLNWLRLLTAGPCNDWALRGRFKEFAAHLHPAALAETATGWPTTAAGWDLWSKGVDELLSVAQFRTQMYSAFA